MRSGHKAGPRARRQPGPPSGARSAQRLERALSGIREQFYLLDAQWRYIYANARAAELAGRAAEELVGCCIWDLFPDLRNTAFYDALLAAAHERQPRHFELEYPPSSRWFEISVYPTDDGVAVMAADVTERKRADGKRRGDETRFRQLADALPQIVWTAAPDGRITFVNRQWQLYTGLTLEQTNQIEAVRQVLHPDDTPLALERWAESLATGKPHEVEWRFKHSADGGYRWFLTRALPIRGDDGRIREWFGTATDIDEQKRAAERLRESEQRFARFMQHLPGLAWIKDTAGRYVYANEASTNAFGLPWNQMVGKTMADVLPASMVPACDESDRRALDGELGVQTEETLRRPDGTLRSVIVNKFPIPGADGKPMLFGGMAIDITERKQAEARLRESEERFAKAFNASPLVLTLSSLTTGKLLEVNETFVQMSGYTREEVIGRTTLELGLWVKAQDRAAEMDAVRRSGGIRNAEYRFRTRSGAERIGLLSAEQIVIGGEPYALTVIQDITERKRIEEALRETEERFARFMRHLPGLAWIKDLSGRYVYANESAAKAFGVPLAQLPGKTDADLFRPETAEQFRENDRKALASPAGVQTLEALQHEDGALRYSIVSKFPIPGSDGGPALVGGIAIDVTEEKRKEEALRNSERLYRAIGESIDYGVWVCEPDGRNIYASESFLRLVGLTQEECSVFGWGKVLHPDDAERTITAWKECVRTGGQWDIEHRFRGVDGEWHPILARGVPVRNERGEITAWAGINLDISRIKQVENQLREADQRKNEFLATLAHELRNPLAPIRNGLEIMRLARHDPQSLERARDMMERQLRHMVHLIDDLLDLSRISRGKIELRKGRVDLAAVVQSAVETSRPLIEQFGHAIAISVPAESMFVEADVTRLAQVFANLLNNAAKYTETGGRIWLTVAREGGAAVVRVKDNGIGIPAHMLPRVFEMFTQVERPLERSEGGLGIGLSIVKRLVEMHGGSVAARSDGHGTGSEFIVRLPVLMSLMPDAETPAAAPAPAAGDGLRVLVADDNVDAAASLAALLKIMGHEVRTARDGLEALEVLTVFRPEVALLDIGMPKLNGYDLCRRIRGQPWGRDVLIVAMTGWGQAEDKRHSQEAGFDKHLVKPVEPAALGQLLAARGKAAANDGAPR